MSSLTRDGTAEPVSRDHFLWRELGQGNILLPCSADHGLDWEPYLVDLHSAIWYGYTYIHTNIHIYAYSQTHKKKKNERGE